MNITQFYQKQQPKYVLALIGVVASSLAFFSPNKLARSLSLSGIIASTSYAIGVASCSQKATQFEYALESRLRGEHEEKLALAEKKAYTLSKDLAAAKEDTQKVKQQAANFYAENVLLNQQVSTYQSQMSRLVADALSEEKKKIWQSYTNQIRKYQNASLGSKVWSEKLLADTETMAQQEIAKRSQFQKVTVEAYDAEIGTWEARYSHFQHELDKTVALFKQDYYTLVERAEHYERLLYPTRFEAKSPPKVIANGVIEFWETQGLRVVPAGDPEWKNGGEILIFQFRSKDFRPLEDFSRLDKQLQYELDLVGDSKYQQHGEIYQISITVRQKERSHETYRPKRLEDFIGSGQCFFVVGNPGSGKSSTLIWLSQQLSTPDSVLIALNPHNNPQLAYKDYGFIEINNVDQIKNTLASVETELRMRAETGCQSPRIIVVVDEGTALKDELEQFKDAFKSLGIQGRKYQIIILAGIHSDARDEWDFGSQIRDSFVEILLVSAARNVYTQQARLDLDAGDKRWIKEAAYPAVVIENGRTTVVEHPTHGSYPSYKDGQAPKNIQKRQPIDFDLATLGQSDRAILSPNASKIRTYFAQKRKPGEVVSLQSLTKALRMKKADCEAGITELIENQMLIESANGYQLA